MVRCFLFLFYLFLIISIVINARNKKLIGVGGIVLLETQRTFIVLNKNNKRKSKLFCFKFVLALVKNGSVFLLKWRDKCIKIYGDFFQYKGSERSKIKFKEKLIMDLL